MSEFRMEKEKDQFKVIEGNYEVVAEIRPLKKGNKVTHWYITRETKTNLDHKKFETAEQAFDFFVGVVEATRKQVDSKPLPEDVMDLFNRQARTLMERDRALQSQLLDLAIEKETLRNLAKRYNVAHCESYIGDPDLNEMVDALLKYEVAVPDENSPETYKMAPFFSESALYEFVGKDAARSVLGMMRRLIGKITPGKESFL